MNIFKVAIYVTRRFNGQMLRDVSATDPILIIHKTGFVKKLVYPSLECGETNCNRLRTLSGAVPVLLILVLIFPSIKAR